jgi:membrane protease YdiL (CAAX protease family)
MPMNLRALLIGKPAYAPQTPWGPISAIGVVALILMVCQFLLPSCLYELFPEVCRKISGSSGPPNHWPLLGAPSFQLLVQIATIGLVWIVAGMRGGDRKKVLRLSCGEGGLFSSAFIACLIWLITFPISFALRDLLGRGLISAGSGMMSDVWLKQYLPLLNTISLVFAAPFLEEFLFRGFLLSAVAKSRIGFWGASLVANTFWVSLHWTFPWYTLSMTFVFGMLFSFAIWKTGSLWPCILAHGLYNLEPALFDFIFSRF